MQPIHIADKTISKEYPCFIIAEAGVNHNGDITLAKQLINAAVDAGADAVKFQTFRADAVVTSTAEKASYQKETTGVEESQYEMIKQLELTYQEFQELNDYAVSKEIIFLSTPFDEDSVDFLDQLGVPAFKIPSGEITNVLLLKKIAETKKPIILSTGMATLGEVEEAVSYLRQHGAQEIVLLHCTTSYPAPIHSVNLRAMETMSCAFKVPVGYSDHTEGITIPIAAAAMGAKVIEKHFTLDRSLPGPDHRASLEPDELKAMVLAIRDVERASGDGVKCQNLVEDNTKKIGRRSIVARYDIDVGDLLSERNITVKRPGTGINPKYFFQIIGKKTKKRINMNAQISWDDISNLE